MKILLILLIQFALLFSLPSQAAGDPYDQTRFERLIKSGEPVAVIIRADWCVTCRAQERVFQELDSQGELKGLALLRVDFDRQKEVVRSFRATLQSTIIVFSGGKEVGRSTADTRKDSIAALLRKAR